MKVIRCVNEGVWLELVKVTLTESESALLNDLSQDKYQDRLNLLNDVNSRKFKPLESNLVSLVNSIYNSHKPKVNGEDHYELISVDMVLKGDKGSGVINCRVNGFHNQVRF